MSLFKTRDLWSTSSDNDLFDLGCLKVANLGINKYNIGNIEKKTSVSLNSYNSIITGSYNGFLRIYNPSRKSNDNDSSNGFKAHELVNETSFPSPILQIETGKFVRYNYFLCIIFFYIIFKLINFKARLIKII